MKDLTERQKFILTLIIHEHIRTATPVGSNALVERYNLDFSSATVRNEMSMLTDLGYLRQPHTSAGRIPSEEGYRYFVTGLLQKSELPSNTRRMISHQFYQSRHDINEWMRLAASVLAQQSHSASVVTAPHPEKARLKHLELISTHGRQVLMVAVMQGGEIYQRILLLDEPVSQEQLSIAAGEITRQFQGKDFKALRSGQHYLHELNQNIATSLAEEMAQADALAAGEVFMDGLSNVLSQPEFSGSEDARRALRVLEERTLLQDLLSRTVLSQNVGGVQVLIGGEGTWDELRQWSIILARYGAPGLATGTLGVLGPIRMHYARSISTIRFMSGLLSDLVTENLAEE
jgi:heat-inducible transcriptional repressor